MSWQATVLVTPTVFAVVTALFLAGYATVQLREGRRDPIVVLFFLITIAATIWAGFSALKLLQTDPEAKLLFFRLLHIGAAALPPLFFLFVVAYTDRTHWLRAELLGGVFVLPASFVALLFVNPGQLIVGETELITNGVVVLRVSGGPGFFVFLLYSTALVMAALGLLLSETRRIGPTYYPQAALLTLALLLPIAFSVLTEAGVPPFTDERINLVPTAAAVSTAAFAVLLVRYRLFELPPLAYATAMKYSPDGLFVLDRDERIVHANDRGHDLLDQLGVTIGEVLTQQLPEFDPGTAAGDLIEVPTDADESAYHRLLVEALSRGGRHVGWVVVFRDETAQQRQQHQLQRQNEQLEMFATTVSHDLRNPLSVAQGYLDIVREDVDNDAIDRIEAAHVRMEDIIEQLLILAHEGLQIADREPVVLADVVEPAWESVETPSAELSVEETDAVLADPSMLQHVFENLFRNAVEHGDAEVRVSVGAFDGGFFVEDDGPGIPEALRDDVFDAGYSTTSDGTGFGLNIVKRVVDAHGWDIGVTDGTTGGARFEFTDVDFAE